MNTVRLARMKRKLCEVESALDCCETDALIDLMSRRALLRTRISECITQICSHQASFPPENDAPTPKYDIKGVLTPTLHGKKRATEWSEHVSDSHSDCHVKGPNEWKKSILQYRRKKKKCY